MKQINLFNNKLQVSVEDMLWQYMCDFRFFSSMPSMEEIEAEFISGTGITAKKIELWSEASERFTAYIEDLKQIYGQEDYFMKLRNLVISGGEVEDLNGIIDGINELALVIEDNFEAIKEREIGIEFNIGSRLGETKEYLVIYSNPSLKDKLYVFILKRESGQLVTETTFESFQCLADLDERKVVNKTIATGFKRLPKFAFPSITQMQEAKRIANSIV